MGTLGIVTIVDNANFGNRLQNFALQECLIEQGWAVETIPNSPSPMRRSLLAARALSALRTDGVATFTRRNGALLGHHLRSRREQPEPTGVTAPARETAIRSFTTEHIHALGTDFADLSDPTELADRYDHVVVGSDQVWNPGFRQANPIDFLTFVRPEQRVAYAASFGVPEVPTFLRRLYAGWLSEIPHLSVREHQAAEIVHDLTGRDVPVVADPTLLLSPGRWHDSAVVPPPLLGKRYLASFFLGGASAAETTALTTHACDEGLEVVDLNSPDEPDLVGLSPLEFIGALRGAEVVATDSFHTSVFALVFRRTTITKARHADDTRLDTLFAHAGIERQRWREDTLSRSVSEDWPAAGERLAALRAESLRFVDSAIGQSVRESTS